MTYVDLQRKLHENPFKPFRIRLVNSTIYDIVEPWMIIVGKTSAVIVTQVGKDDKGFQMADDWRTVSISHIVEFSDLEPKKRHRKSA